MNKKCGHHIVQSVADDVAPYHSAGRARAPDPGARKNLNPEL
jgi:hypothetical protein